MGTGDPDPQVRYFAGIPTGQPASTCGSTLLVSSLRRIIAHNPIYNTATLMPELNVIKTSQPFGDGFI